MSICAAYVLEHVATGKRIIGSTKDVKRCLAKHREELKDGTHKLKSLLELYRRDPQLKEKVYLTDTLEEAKKIERQLIEELKDSYLLLDPRPKSAKKTPKK